jgi:hypothetical protein
MNKEKLREEFTRLRVFENELLDIYLEYFLKSIQDFQIKGDTPRHLRDAILVNQMLFTKVGHLKQLITGIEFTSKTGAKLKKIIDPTVVASVVRTIFETVGMFNHIYIQTKSDEERIIIYNLWAIAGLNYRQKFAGSLTMPENIQKAKEELDQINILKDQIEQMNLFKGLSQRDRERIYDKIGRKEYNIRFEKGFVKGVGGFQEFIENSGVRPRLMDNMYTHFSLNSHPSNVAVFQFGDMFQANDPKFFELTNFNVKNAVYLLSIFVADYIRLFPELINTFNNQPLIDQIIINFSNSFMRGEEFDINKAYESLN